MLILVSSSGQWIFVLSREDCVDYGHIMYIILLLFQWTAVNVQTCEWYLKVYIHMIRRLILMNYILSRMRKLLILQYLTNVLFYPSKKGSRDFILGPGIKKILNFEVENNLQLSFTGTSFYQKLVKLAQIIDTGRYTKIIFKLYL